MGKQKLIGWAAYFLAAIASYLWIGHAGPKPSEIDYGKLSIPDATTPIDFPGQVEPLEKLPVGLNGKPVSDDGRWKLILKYVGTIHHDVSGYTPHDDPGFGKRYANRNFLLGGKLYHPERPFRTTETYVRRHHYTVAVPKRYAHLHEDLVWDGLYWNHRYRLKIDGYTPPDVYAVPRDRIVAYDRFDALYTGDKAVRRAKKWGVRKRLIEVYRYDWVLEVQP